MGGLILISNFELLTVDIFHKILSEENKSIQRYFFKIIFLNNELYENAYCEHFP